MYPVRPDHSTKLMTKGPPLTLSDFFLKIVSKGSKGFTNGNKIYLYKIFYQAYSESAPFETISRFKKLEIPQGERDTLDFNCQKASRIIIERED